MIRVGVYCHLSFSDSVRFDQGSAITMMMSILLVLVQFPRCWAANCSSRPWVGKTATMKYNSELFSLRDIMSWWCLFKVLYPVTYFVLTLSYPPTKSCMWHRVKVQVNVVKIMRPQVRVESSWAYITFIRCICVSGKSDPIKVIFSKCDCNGKRVIELSKVNVFQKT